MEKKRLIPRNHAEQYLLLTLLSFAAAVAITRAGLFLTGYPQLGNSELHIAHVLWGGILLFAACLLMLMFANRQIRILGSVLAGAGVGLFIDEVGKFITQSNDYFYPAAAPIIYAFFLLTFFAFVMFQKRKKPSSREEMYHIAQQLEEILDHDLTITEQKDMKNRLLRVIAQADEIEQRNLAEVMLKYLEENALYVTTDKDTLIYKITKAWVHFEKHHFSRKRMRIVIALFLIGLAVWIALTPLYLITSYTALADMPSLSTLVDENILQQMTNTTVLYALIIADVVLGSLLILSAIMLLLGKDRSGTLLALISLLTLISAVNLFVFYYDQFSSISIASVEFLILFVLIRYRKRFIIQSPDGNITV